MRSIQRLYKDQRWLLIAALLATIGYLAVLVDIVSARFTALVLGPLNELGDFLAGAASPLAFLWLVVGYFLQRHELSLQRQQLEEQRTETAKLAGATEQIKDFDARDLAFRSLEIGREELNKTAHLIYHRWLHESVMPSDYYNLGLKPQFDAGDRDIFCRELIDRLQQHWTVILGRLGERLQSAPELQVHIARFIEIFTFVEKQVGSLPKDNALTPFLASQSEFRSLLQKAMTDANIKQKEPNQQ